MIKDINTKLNKPIVTYFRKFSAPVIWETDSTYDEEIFIVENEIDLFTKYDSINRLYEYIISKNDRAREPKKKLRCTICPIRRKEKHTYKLPESV